MIDEEWEASENPQHMLKMLHQEQPDFLATQITQLHKFLIACCWKHKHLIPQRNLRNGLLGAERWIAGEITDEELNELNWYAEAEAFIIDYAETADEIASIRSLIEGIDEIRGMPFAQARKLLLDAAYFTEQSMIYSKFRRLPWINSLFTSKFLCPDLLREHIVPSSMPIPNNSDPETGSGN